MDSHRALLLAALVSLVVASQVWVFHYSAFDIDLDKCITFPGAQFLGPGGGLYRRAKRARIHSACASRRNFLEVLKYSHFFLLKKL